MRRLCYVAVVAFPVTALAAQEAPALQLGSRVRVTSREGSQAPRRVTGALESIDSASIVLHRADGTAVALPRTPDTRIEVGEQGLCSPGRRGTCVALGFVGGVGLGFAIGAIGIKAGHCVGDQCGLAYLLTLPIGIVIGTVAGAVIGNEHWHARPLPVRMSLVPEGPGTRSAGGVHLGLQLAF